MWLENKVFKEDLDYIINVDFIDWSKLDNKTVFITGATGLIGYYLTCALLYRNMMCRSQIKIIALVRNMEKAKQMFYSQLDDNNINFIEGELEDFHDIEDNIDYIIHGAGPTDSRYFIEHPVETIKSLVSGSLKILAFAKNKNIAGMVYLSSMEVYGNNKNEEYLCEDSELKLNSSNLRDCYPISKSLIENLNLAYFSEYGLPVNSLRISQTIGAIKNSFNTNKKIVSEIVDCVIDNRDIILLTKGDSKRTYVYVGDVVTAVLTTLLCGKYGDFYNVSNINSFSSIYDMANMVSKKITMNKINVIVNTEKSIKNLDRFPKPNILNLSSEKLSLLGWKALVNLEEMFRKVIESRKG
jgi:nucleoside-diphosphate-sugar epimerase